MKERGRGRGRGLLIACILGVAACVGIAAALLVVRGWAAAAQAWEVRPEAGTLAADPGSAAGILSADTGTAAGIPSAEAGLGADLGCKPGGKDNPAGGRGPALKDFLEHPGEPVVVVDPGHGGIDEGCARDGIREKDINLSIALLVESRLKELGYHVILARAEDTCIDKEKRVETANFWQADVYVSIHQNASDALEANGIETWYYGADTTRDSRRLARLINQEAAACTGAAVRQLRDDADFCVTGKTQMPACLIETGFLSNTEERARLMDPAYQEKLAEGIAKGIDLFLHPKTMYLTFDDGPSAENTNAVLDILQEKNVKATFFVVGENVRRNPEVARRIVAEGHTIGIHCDSHEYKKIYASVDSYLADFEAACNTVREVTGVEPRLFRFPGGSINSYNKDVREGIIQEMTARGYIYFDWNASLQDAVKKADPAQLIINARETALGRKKVVLLAHDVLYPTVQCLEELLDQFPEYRMEVLTPEVEPVQFRGKD